MALIVPDAAVHAWLASFAVQTASAPPAAMTVAATATLRTRCSGVSPA